MNEAARKSEIERLERAFWQSMVDGEPAVATGLLTEPALMVASHGVNKFDHAAYEKMARDDSFRLVDYEITGFDVVFPTDDVAVAAYAVKQAMEMKGQPVTEDVFDTSTWVRTDGRWRCVAHTESRRDPATR
jgi:hypothetical protein